MAEAGECLALADTEGSLYVIDHDLYVSMCGCGVRVANHKLEISLSFLLEGELEDL